MVSVIQVERTHSVEVTDGYWIVKFLLDREGNRLRTIFKGVNKSKMHEPVYIPKNIYADFVRRAYAVFYNSKKKKVERVDPYQLMLNL